jgi:hypothetical protein
MGGQQSKPETVGKKVAKAVDKVGVAHDTS